MSEPTPDPLVRRWLWRTAGRILFRCSAHNWNPWRRTLLRAFGSQIGDGAKVRRSARIDRPWNLSIGALSAIGDDAVVGARWPVRIGARSVVSQYVILSSEARDPTRPGCPTAGAPITIGDDCWVATDALVLPGITIERGTVAGARSLVSDDLPEWTIATGEPAAARWARRFREQGTN